MIENRWRKNTNVTLKTMCGKTDTWDIRHRWEENVQMGLRGVVAL
jgi:hypothetical protein